MRTTSFLGALLYACVTGSVGDPHGVRPATDEQRRDSDRPVDGLEGQDDEGPGTRIVTWIDDVAPLLEDAGCLGCHDAVRREHGLDLSSYAGAMRGSEHGSVVVPTLPAMSLLYTQVATGAMPPREAPGARPLTGEEGGLIEQWIEVGALSGNGEVPDPDSGPVRAWESTNPFTCADIHRGAYHDVHPDTGEATTLLEQNQMVQKCLYDCFYEGLADSDIEPNGEYGGDVDEIFDYWERADRAYQEARGEQGDLPTIDYDDIWKFCRNSLPKRFADRLLDSASEGIVAWTQSEPDRPDAVDDPEFFPPLTHEAQREVLEEIRTTHGEWATALVAGDEEAAEDAAQRNHDAHDRASRRFAIPQMPAHDHQTSDLEPDERERVVREIDRIHDAWIDAILQGNFDGMMATGISHSHAHD